MSKDLIKKRLNETLSKEAKSEIKDEVLSVLKSRDFKDEIESMVTKEVKGNKQLEDKVVDITKNVITQLYKALWTKRGFWRNMLSNKAS